MHEYARALARVDLNLLVVLDALLAEASVTRAAKVVGLSQSAASHALGRLRAVFDDALLVRSGQRLVLTPRAAALRPALERVLSDLHATIAGPRAFDPSTATRSFRIGSADYALALFAAPLLGRLDDAAPGVSLEVFSAPRLLPMIDDGTIDLALVVEAAPASGHAMRDLFTDDYVCMVRRDHPRIGETLDLTAYLSERHIVVAPTGAPGSIVDASLAKRGRQRRIAMRIPSFLAVPVVVAQSDLLNTGPRRLAEALGPRSDLRILPVPRLLSLPTFTLRMAWHKKNESDPAHRWLRDLVADIAAGLSRSSPPLAKRE